MSESTDITLTSLRIEDVTIGLRGLDGLRLKSGEFEPFNFQPETTFKIANNLAVFSEKAEAINRTKKMLSARYQVYERMSVTAENAKQVGEFMEALAILEDSVVKIAGVEIISRAALNVGCDAKKNQNRIPPSVLAAIAPVLGE